MAYFPHIIAYIGLGVFLIACVLRIAMWVRMPMHVRWELYPVAHEPGLKAKYGGSYLEETEWWKKPREKSLVGELKVMVPEMLFLVALKEHNPKLWYRSFPFHFGLYIVIGATVLMMFVGVVGAFAPDLFTGALAAPLHWVILVSAVGGVAMSWLGALGLLHRRLTDPELRDFTPPADIFNLMFFLVTFGLVLVHFWMADPDLARTTAFVQGLVTFSPTALTGTPMEIGFTSATIVMMALLVAYIPLTHMSHFIGKYFSYHAIRWNDEPNLKGGDQEAAIGALLTQPVTWDAPHIKGEGKKTWLDLATEDMKK
jgi:nitrate reductase gamma subunit